MFWKRHVYRGLLMVAVLALALVPTLGLAQGQSALDDPLRTDADRDRDAGSKPLELYGFFGVEPGMTVVDLMPGGGYNTHVLSLIVEHGRVLSGPDRRGSTAERVEAAGLSNVEVFTDFATVIPSSVDVMITVRNIHDVENRGDTGPVYASYLAALKPGGIFGVVDARTPKEGFDDSTHRINEQHVVDALTAAGFELVERSEMYANPGDDFDQSFRGSRWTIDRFALKFRRPAN
ncbi:MAG TPA: hypothetical protein QGG47_08400 [Acidobacteriota bacterium]|nr:hypothetical protein [Acidobacteriota bacterium]